MALVWVAERRVGDLGPVNLLPAEESHEKSDTGSFEEIARTDGFISGRDYRCHQLLHFPSSRHARFDGGGLQDYLANGCPGDGHGGLSDVHLVPFARRGFRGTRT